ncbi:succinate dehydrogenase, cytochrome b556 subunit [Candidatus Hepatobacter penaei]|uniref:succinate dehydrogenase, cytochrome b556 subunit n=1 Tax=Candidatus Hepatobacter penaei TaxID=1274402 RepID=UPI000696CF29|nr:succinate dehydrogenase, cytochrome b556 subunit [Candidatus Hepatobacter penaei]
MHKTHRPLSPHLQIYKLQLTSFLSITHRASEVFLFVLALGWSWALCTDYVLPYEVLFFPGIWLLWFVFVIVLYHMLGVVRHILLDLGIGFSLNAIAVWGWAMIVVWVLISAYVAGYLWYEF